MGIRGEFSIRQYHCCIIFSVLVAVLSFSVFAHEITMDEPVRMPLLVDSSWLLERVGAPGVVVVDTRDAVEYQGFDSQSDHQGHIATALNIPSDTNLEARQGIYYFKSRPALEELYKDLADYSVVIRYCNNGCESSASCLALRLLGKTVNIYEGGWREWGSDPRLPVEASLQ